MTSNFFTATSNCEIAPKELFFFNRKPNFVQKKIFQKQFLLENFFLCELNVVLDTQKRDFSNSQVIFFSKTLKNFSCTACLCMPWSMSDSLNIQNLKIVIFENFCQNLKILMLSIHHLSKKILIHFRSFPLYCKCEKNGHLRILMLSNIWFLSLVFGYEHIPKILWKYVFF